MDIVPERRAFPKIHAVTRRPTLSEILPHPVQAAVEALLPPRRRLDLHRDEPFHGLAQYIDLRTVVASPEAQR